MFAALLALLGKLGATAVASGATAGGGLLGNILGMIGKGAGGDSMIGQMINKAGTSMSDSTDSISSLLQNVGAVGKGEGPELPELKLDLTSGMKKTSSRKSSLLDSIIANR